MKLEADWKVQRKLIEMLYEMTSLHFKDLKRSIYGEGNYRLHGKYREMFIPRNVWKTYDEVKRSKMFSNFLENKIIVKDGKTGFINLRTPTLQYRHCILQRSLVNVREFALQKPRRKTPNNSVQRCISSA